MLIAASMMQLLSGRSILWTHVLISLNLRLGIGLVGDQPFFILHQVILVIIVVVVGILFRRNLWVGSWMVLGANSDLWLRAVTKFLEMWLPTAVTSIFINNHLAHRVTSMLVLVMH